MKLDEIIDPEKLVNAMIGGFFCFGVLVFTVFVIFAMAR